MTPGDQAARDRITTELDRSLFVEAGAGTGKTSALVGRICELVLTDDDAQRIDLSQLAAITFTEAAAAELRDRIRTEFESRLRAARARGDAVAEARCERALVDADVAAISTLHAFAQRLLSEYPVEVGIPPRVEVIDEVQSILAFDERWSEFVDELYDDRDLEEFIVRAAILRVGIGAASSPLRSLAHVFDDNWDRLEGLDVPAPLVAPIGWSALQARIDHVRGLSAGCLDRDDRLHARIESLRLDRFASLSRDVERLRFVRGLASASGLRNGKAPNWPDKQAVVDACAAMVDEARQVVEAVADQTLALLGARIAAFTLRAADARRAEGMLEFHDLLVLARKLLRDSAEARRGLSERYRVLMLDEFQDTDPIQIELALLLTSAVEGNVVRDLWDLEPAEGRMFMVGDPKQSIYRFRRADIEVFDAASTKFVDGHVELNHNFRTTAPIIDVVNAYFPAHMDGSRRGSVAYRPLQATRSPSSVDHRPIVFGGGRAEPAAGIRAREAVDVASIISSIRETPGDWLIDDGAGGWREPRMADVTILLPTRTSLTQLGAALDASGIPYRADTGTLVYETQEVRDLLSVLRAVDDPSNEVALVAALRSPLYACADDDLLVWREAGGQWSVRGAVPDAVGDSPVADALEHLRSLAARRWWDEPAELLARIVEERHVMALATGQLRPRDTWRRIRYIVDQARAFSDAGGGDLRAYLDWTALQGVDGSKAHEPMLAEPDDDAVRIMTIHGAKGLEFPITVVSGLTTRDPRSARGVEVIWDTDGSFPHIRLRSDLRTSDFDLRRDLEAEMDQLEKDRLLYVALTRARDHLVVSAHHQVKKDGTPHGSHGARIHEFASTVGERLVRLTDDAAWAPGSGASPPTTDAVAPASADAPAPSETLEGWSRRHAQLIESASRRGVVSATHLAASVRAEEPEERPEDPADDLADTDERMPPQPFRRGRAGTAIGSAVHAVLQFVDLADPDPAHVERLVEAQAWNESVPEHADTIARAVRAALDAPIVASCRVHDHWKELFVAAPVGDVTIEGYVDLLVDIPEGLVVVDYKTDSVSSEAEIDAKLERYEMQGAAYAVAVETATARPVVDVRFVFTSPGGAVERSARDLDALKARVRATVAPA